MPCSPAIPKRAGHIGVLAKNCLRGVDKVAESLRFLYDRVVQVAAMGVQAMVSSIFHYFPSSERMKNPLCDQTRSPNVSQQFEYSICEI